jgi:hypothetical protein
MSFHIPNLDMVNDVTFSSHIHKLHIQYNVEKSITDLSLSRENRRTMASTFHNML